MMKNDKMTQCVWKIKCPLSYDELQSTNDPRYRFCNVCEKKVYKCNNMNEAIEHAQKEHCIALNVVSDNEVEVLQGYLDIPKFLRS